MILEAREAVFGSSGGHFGGSGGHLEAREVIWEAREVILEARECFFRRLGRLLEERGWRGKVFGSWVFHSLGVYFWGGDFSYIFLQGKCTTGACRRIGLIQKQGSQKKKAKK